MSQSGRAGKYKVQRTKTKRCGTLKPKMWYVGLSLVTLTPRIMKFNDLCKRTHFATIAIQLLIMVTFGLAVLTKWMAGGVPGSFADQFGDTWMGLFPGGLFLTFYTIVIAETLVFLLAAASFLRGEWLAYGKAPLLRFSLVLSLFIFVVLGYGLRLTGQFGGAANAYFYFGATLVALWYTEQMASTQKTAESKNQGE